jgi:hypothetical protein
MGNILGAFTPKTKFPDYHQINFKKNDLAKLTTSND